MMMETDSVDELGGTEQDVRTPSDRVRSLVSVSAELAGGAVSGALGFMVAGPVGAAAAGVGGVAISKILIAAGEDVCDRLLSPREKARVGAALAVSLDRTRERLEAGDEVRTDGFITNGTDRPPVEEVTEGLLLAAQRAYDEKKVPFIGRLSANLNFRSDMDVRAASVLVRLADQLSYQQLCMLRLAYENQAGTPLTGGKYEDGFKSTAHAALLSDLLELERNGFINNGGVAVLGLDDLDPPSVRLQAFGVHLFELMELNRIEDADLEPLREALNRPYPAYVSVKVNTEKSAGNYHTSSNLLTGRIALRRNDEADIA